MTPRESEPELILASASPRRRELLRRLGVDFTVVPSDVDEWAPGRHPRAERLARHLAREKALAVAASHPDAVVLAADTIVVQQSRLLAKPADAREAREMLGRLRGRDHRVITGVAVARGRQVRVAHAVTHVRMREYGHDEIERYIARGGPFDKAGGYAIQDPAFAPVDRYTGCYCNVVGLPLGAVIPLLVSTGVETPVTEPARLTPECPFCPLFASPTP
ncbi:MAG TPA: Maf family protein [Thermomicrobiales bacterium]|nr:Maf family protein [Thermomicrobiales bacterium]